MIEALCHHDQRQSEARDRQEYLRQQDNTSSPIADFLSLVQTNQEATAIPDNTEGTAAAAPAPWTKITVEKYQCCKALKEAHVPTFLNETEHGEMLTTRTFPHRTTLPTSTLAISMPTPALEEVPEPAASNESTTIPKITVSMPGHHPMATANRVPGFGWEVALSSVSPMQVGTLIMSPQKTLMHCRGITTLWSHTAMFIEAGGNATWPTATAD